MARKFILIAAALIGFSASPASASDCSSIMAQWQPAAISFSASLSPAVLLTPMAAAMPKGGSGREDAIATIQKALDKSKADLPALRDLAVEIDRGGCAKSGNAVDFISKLEEMIALYSDQASKLR
jgi:hypothetical protein